MVQFRIEVADHQGAEHFFNIRTVDNEHFQIFNEQQERLATIEIDQDDHNHYRQSLDCKITIPLLDFIKESIVLHEQLVHT